MKNLKILILLCSLIVSCSKKTTPIPITNTSNATTQSVLNSDEIAVKGKWNLAEKLVYINGVSQASMTVTYTANTSYFIKLDSLDVVPQNGTWKSAVNSIKGTSISTQWKANNDTILMSGINFKISGVTTTSLTLHQGQSTVDTFYVYNFGR